MEDKKTRFSHQTYERKYELQIYWFALSIVLGITTVATLSSRIHPAKAAANAQALSPQQQVFPEASRAIVDVARTIQARRGT